MIEINIKYRVDFVGLSTDTKPSEQLENGSTFYTVDTQELYVYYAGEWYLQAPIETSSDEETPVSNDTKKEIIEEPIEKRQEPIEETREPVEEPIENPEPVEEKKSGDEK